MGIGTNRQIISDDRQALAHHKRLHLVREQGVHPRVIYSYVD